MTARATYKALEDEMLIDGQIYRRGAEVQYDGVPDRNLKPLNAKAEANMKAADAIRKDRDMEPEDRTYALRDLDDKLRGIGEYADADDQDEAKEDPALVKHAVAAAKEHEKAQQEDTNFTKVKLQGPNDPTPAEKQGGSSKK